MLKLKLREHVPLSTPFGPFVSGNIDSAYQIYIFVMKCMEYHCKFSNRGKDITLEVFFSENESQIIFGLNSIMTMNIDFYTWYSYEQLEAPS